MKPTEKQVELLKKLEVDFDEEKITKEEAKKIISASLKKTGSVPSFSQNYRDHNGTWKTVKLTVEELARLRGVHRQHCVQILEECSEDFPDDRELLLAVFDKRADKIFTWIQQSLDEKVRETRGGSNGSQH